MRSKIVKVSDKFQKSYTYELVEPVGRNFHPDFKPELTPKQMLESQREGRANKLTKKVVITTSFCCQGF